MGADAECLLRIHRSVVRLRLDYGCFVYGSARPSALRILDLVHHQELRLVTGAYRTSPIPSLYAIAHEPSLENRRAFLAMLYRLKISALPWHPCYHVVRTDTRHCIETSPTQ